MRTPMGLRVGAALLVLLALGLGESRAAEDTAGKFVLRIGRTEHEVTLGQPFRLPTADGGSVESVLRLATLRYIGYGFRFSYPGTMDLEVQARAGGAWIRVGHGVEYFLVIQVHPRDDSSVEEARKVTVRATRAWMEDQGATLGPETSCTEEIAGEIQEGTRSRTVGDENAFVQDVYALEVNGRVLAMTFSYREKVRKDAWEAFRVLTGSLRVPEPDEGKERNRVSQYVLEVGGREHAVDLAKEFLIVTPDGESVLAVLRRAPVAFADFGIRFSHPGNMEVETGSPPGRKMLILSRGDEYSASFQIFEAPSALFGPKNVRDLHVKFVKASVEKTGTRIRSERACSRELAGIGRVGTRLTTEGPDPMAIEIYAFVLGERMTTVCLTYRKAKEEEATRAFRMIGGTLKAD